MHGLPRWSTAYEWPALVAAVGVLLALALARIVFLQRALASGRQSKRSRPSAGATAATVAALLATGVGLNTNWRFAGDYLKITGVAERSLLFTVAEASLLACALMAREEMNRSGRTGTPGTLVWAITAVASVSAIAEAHGSVAGGVFRVCFGPLGAAILWHLAMGLEFRRHRGDARKTGLAALLLAEGRERLLARLGMVDGARAARQIAQDRALLRAVELADQYSAAPSPRRASRLASKLRKALRQAGVAADETRKQSLLDEVAVSRHGTELATLELPSPWSVAPAQPVVPVSQPTTSTVVPVPRPSVGGPAGPSLAAAARAAAAVGAAPQPGAPTGQLPDDYLAQLLDWLAVESPLTPTQVAQHFGIPERLAERVLQDATFDPHAKGSYAAIVSP